MIAMLNVLSLSPRAFADLGLEEIAYVKPVAAADGLGFAIHASNGTRLAVLADRIEAFALIRRHNMQPASLQ
jgi:hypothetical protein